MSSQTYLDRYRSDQPADSSQFNGFFELVTTVLASIGILNVESSDSPEKLLERADEVMYRPKERGGHQYVLEHLE